MIEFTIKNKCEIRLSKAVFQYNPSISYGHVMTLLRKKDVMVNGVRTNKDVLVKSGDLIRLYTTVHTPDTYVYDVETVFENDHVFVFWKPKGLETQGEISLEAHAKRLCATALACHRLDVNTDGLLIVAKSEQAKDAICKQMNDGHIQKFYLTALYGRLSAPKIDKSAFIVKDADKGISRVIDGKTAGALPIRTVFSELGVLDGFTVAEVRLFTGRTHQIRAQAFAMGNYVLGDGKYCPDKIKRQFPFKKQALTAYKLTFDTDIAELNGINGKTLQHECALLDMIN